MAAGITINGSGIGGAFVGSSEVGKIYLGNVEVYSKPSADVFTINITFATGMDGEGYLRGIYGSETIFDDDNITYETPPATYQVALVAGQQMVISYYVDHGYCSISVNGTEVHNGSHTGSYTMSPQVGDVIAIDWYFED